MTFYWTHSTKGLNLRDRNFIETKAFLPIRTGISAVIILVIALAIVFSEDFSNTVKFIVISQEQLHITKISYGKEEGKTKLVDSKSSSDRKKVTKCNHFRESYSIRCFFRSFGTALS